MKRVWSDWVYVIYDGGPCCPLAAFVSAYAAVQFFKKFSDRTRFYPHVLRYRCKLHDPMDICKEDMSLRWIDMFESNDEVKNYDLPF